MTRKGFEIAISTLVVLVLGIAIVTGGILLLRSITAKSSELADQVTSQQQTALKGLLDQGQLVAVYPGALTVTAGKPITSAVAILNTHDQRPAGYETFSINHVVKDENGDASAAAGKISIVHFQTVNLARNEQTEQLIVVKPAADTPQGIYTVIVTVKDGDDQVYDSPRFFTVRVQ